MTTPLFPSEPDTDMVATIKLAQCAATASFSQNGVWRTILLTFDVFSIDLFLPFTHPSPLQKQKSKTATPYGEVKSSQPTRNSRSEGIIGKPLS